jgi:hypothetical protein
MPRRWDCRLARVIDVKLYQITPGVRKEVVVKEMIHQGYESR